MRRARAPIGLWLVAASALLPSVAFPQLVVEDSIYDCTIIASTDEFPEGFGGIAPSINASGRVVFTAALEGFTREIRTGVGDTDAMDRPITLPVVRSGSSKDPDAFFSAFERPIMNDGGEIVWKGNEHPTGGPPRLGIYRKRFSEPFFAAPDALFLNQLTDPKSPYVAFQIYPTLNSGLRFLFRATRDDGVRGLFRGTVDGASLVAQDNAGGIQGIDPRHVIHPGQQPWYAFTASLEGGSESGLFIDGSLAQSVDFSEGGFGGLSIAGSAIPVVSYVQSVVGPTSTTWQLRTATLLGSTVYVDSGVDEPDLATIPPESSLNSFGEVVFGGASGDPLLFADGDVLRRVICHDQFDIFGAIGFFNYDLSPRAINNDGEIAFLGQTGFIVIDTGEFETFIVRATPLQHPRPVSCTGLADGTPCDDDDPLTVAFCAAQECVADPVPEPAAGLLQAVAVAVLAGMLRTARGRRGRRDPTRSGPTAPLHA